MFNVKGFLKLISIYDCEESWALKSWCFWTVLLEKTLESPLDCKEIWPVHPKGDQSWVFFGRNDAKAETPVLWPPQVESWLIGKDSDAGRDWGQEEKGTTEDEMAGWHHRLDAHEFEWTPGVGDGQGGLACCDSWGRKESDTTERLNWTVLNWMLTSGFSLKRNSLSQHPLAKPANIVKSGERASQDRGDGWCQLGGWAYCRRSRSMFSESLTISEHMHSISPTFLNQ